MNTPTLRVQELCESRGGRPGLPVPNNHYCLYGRKATLNDELRSCVKVEVDVLDSPSLIVINDYGLCGRKATLNDELRSCVKVEVDVLMVSVDVKQH